MQCRMLTLSGRATQATSRNTPSIAVTSGRDDKHKRCDVQDKSANGPNRFHALCRILIDRKHVPERVASVPIT
jgi:hypothetical protein